MKKYLIALIFLPAVAMATDTNNMTVTGRVITQRMDVSTMGKVVQVGFMDGSTQTTAGYVRFKDEGTFFMNGSTIDCVGAAITCTDQGNGVTRINVTASGGSGGGGGSGFVYDGSANTAVSTAAYPGATITSDGQGFSTVTYMPAINSTYTWASGQFTTGFSSISAIGVSTQTIQAFFALRNSTNDVSLDVIRSSMVAIRQSTGTFETRFNTFASTATTQDEIFKGWFSTTSAVNDVQNSTITAIRASTATLETTLAQRTQVGSDEGSSLGGDVTRVDYVGSGVSASQSGSTLTVTINSSGGGGGGSMSGFIYTGGATVQFSTISPQGATITSDGNGMSTFTWTPQIFSTFTALTSTGVSLSRNWDSTFSTWTAFVTFTSTTQAEFGVFKVQNSSSDAALDVIRSSMVVIRQSTATFENRFNLFSSTTQADLDVIRSSMVVIRQSTSTFETRFNTFASTVTSQDENFKGWFSTTSAVSDVQNSTIQAIVRSTTSLEVKLSTVTLVYNTGIALTAFVQGTNVTLTQSGSSLTIAASASGGSGSDGFGNPTSTRPITATSGVDASSAVVISSLNVMGVATSSTGFIAPGATFTAVDISRSLMVGVSISSPGFTFIASTETGHYHLGVTTSGHINSLGAVPSIGSCGSGPTVLGNDHAGTVTAGFGANGCTLTFGVPYRNVPSCVLSTTAGGTNIFTYAISKTGLLASQVSITDFNYICVGSE